MSTLQAATPNKPADSRAFHFDRAFYPLKDACHVGGFSRSWLYIQIAAGKVKIIKLGKKSLMTADELARLLAAIRDGAL